MEFGSQWQCEVEMKQSYFLKRLQVYFKIRRRYLIHQTRLLYLINQAICPRRTLSYNRNNFQNYSALQNDYYNWYDQILAFQIQKIQAYSEMSEKYCIVLSMVLMLTLCEITSEACKLTITNDPDIPENMNKLIQMYPSGYSSPVDNLNSQVFSIFKAEPLDGCTVIKQPNLAEFVNIQHYSYLIVVDGDVGFCGIRRRIQMAKTAGAKGLIVVTTQKNDMVDPYGDFTDSTFFVFNVLKTQSSKSALFPNKYILVSISSPTSIQTKPIFELWLSALDTKSYELVSIWEETLKEVPIFGLNTIWRPRYALWGCNSGLFAPGSICLDNSQYQTSCACAGQFCSPQTKYKAADAPIKQDARQKIIYNKYHDKYLAYMQAFRINCLKSFQTQFFAEDCANSQMISLGIDHDKVHEQLQEFTGKCAGSTFNQLMLDRNRFAQLGSYPNAILDKQPINFSTKRELQVELCRKLGLDKEQGCIKIIRISTIASFTINVLFFVLIIGGLVAIVAVLLLVYRKTIRKQMQKEMKMQVSASVQHYFALTQTK